jgi:serine/threonine protein kinase
VALKTSRAADAERLAITAREFEVLKHLAHPNITRALDFFSVADAAVLVLELFPGRELDVFVRQSPQKCLSEDRARDLSAQLWEAIRFLHDDCDIIHRDVKAANVLVSEQHTLKLIDFNTACRLADGSALTMTGTHEYAAPEVLRGKSPSASNDVWGAGLCSYLMLAGRLPRRADKYVSLKDFAAATEKSVMLTGGRWSDLSKACRDAVAGALAVDEEGRVTPAGFLQQPWFEAIDTSSSASQFLRRKPRGDGSSSRSTSCGSSVSMRSP